MTDALASLWYHGEIFGGVVLAALALMWLNRVAPAVVVLIGALIIGFLRGLLGR
jgi:hypothetical protein